MRNAKRLGLCAVLLALGACSSPESRIKKNLMVFATYPPETQEDIRAGRVRLGFTKDMVQLALGEPDQKFARTTESGFREVWVYSDYSAMPVNGVYRGSGTGAPLDQDVGTIEKARMIFQDGKLVAIERHQQQ